MTQFFMLRIRLRTCQGSVLGGPTLPILEALINNQSISNALAGLDAEKCGDCDPTEIPSGLLM
jgi:hypothetical protein